MRALPQNKEAMIIFVQGGNHNDEIRKEVFTYSVSYTRPDLSDWRFTDRCACRV